MMIGQNQIVVISDQRLLQCGNIVCIGQIMEELQPYFAYTFTDVASHLNHLNGYYAKCRELLAEVQGNTVTAKSPYLYVGITPANVVFDETVSFDAQ